MSDDKVAPKKRGRPTKKSVVSKTKGHRKALGRPKGDAAIINEFKARMLASPQSEKVLHAIFSAALDDDHKHQSAAWKIVMDRVAPTAAFEQDVVKGGGRSAIQINITGIGAPEPTVLNDLEGEYISDED